MEQLLKIAALILGLAISLNTIYLAFIYYFEYRKQRHFALTKLKLKMILIMREAERILKDAKDIPKTDANEQIDGDGEQTSIAQESINSFVSGVENLQDINIDIEQDKLFKYINFEQSNSLCDFIEVLQDFKSSLKRRAITLKTEGSPRNVNLIDKLASTRFDKLNDKYHRFKNTMGRKWSDK